LRQNLAKIDEISQKIGEIWQKIVKFGDFGKVDEIWQSGRNLAKFGTVGEIWQKMGKFGEISKNLNCLLDGFFDVAY